MKTKPTSEECYRAVRHMSAELIRTIRAELDFRVNPDKIKRSLKGRLAAMKIPASAAEAYYASIDGAIDYMVEHPELGVVRWIDGEQYEFVSESNKESENV